MSEQQLIESESIYRFSTVLKVLHRNSFLSIHWILDSHDMTSHCRKRGKYRGIQIVDCINQEFHWGGARPPNNLCWGRVAIARAPMIAPKTSSVIAVEN